MKIQKKFLLDSDWKIEKCRALYRLKTGKEWLQSTRYLEELMPISFCIPQVCPGFIESTLPALDKMGDGLRKKTINLLLKKQQTLLEQQSLLKELLKK